MDTKPRIKPCPRCADDKGELVEVHGLGMAFPGETFIAVECQNCGFRSMAGEDDEHAIKLWNEEPDLSGV